MISSVVVPDGNAVEFDIEWHDMDGVAEIPTSVRYQVFDFLTRASVSDIVTVSPVAATMSVIVPGSDLPAGATNRRRLVVQIEATYSAGDTHTADVDIVVARGYSWT